MTSQTEKVNVYTLDIRTRADYKYNGGDGKYSFHLYAQTLDDLVEDYQEYLNEHRGEENHMKDAEWLLHKENELYKLANGQKMVGELNCAYSLKTGMSKMVIKEPTEEKKKLAYETMVKYSIEIIRKAYPIKTDEELMDILNDQWKQLDRRDIEGWNRRGAKIEDEIKSNAKEIVNSPKSSLKRTYRSTQSKIGLKNKIEFPNQLVREKNEKMTDKVQTQNIAFFTAFLGRCGEIDDELIHDDVTAFLTEAWTSEETQAQFMELVKSMTPKLETKTVKKAKKKKDPDAPKKNKSSYIFYCSDVRAVITKENPGLKSKEIVSEMGRQWRETSDKDKQKYIDLASIDKERYIDDMKTYEPPVDGESDNEAKRKTKTKTKTKTKKKKDPNAPKKNKNSYIFYCVESRSQTKTDNPDMTPKEIITEMGTNWRELSVNEKQQFVDMAAVDKERYTKEIACYTSGESDGDSDVSEKKVVLTKKKTPSGYQHFMKLVRPDLKTENPKMTGREVTAELNRMWKNEADKEDWSRAAEEGEEVR
jgi:hypothetical protein